MPPRFAVVADLTGAHLVGACGFCGITVDLLPCHPDETCARCGGAVTNAYDGWPCRCPGSGDAPKRTARRVESRIVTVAAHVGEGTELYGEECRTAEKVARVLGFLGARTQEEFWVILLDGKHRLTATAHVSTGTLSMSIVHPREVFAPAIAARAAAIIVAHNHPSGDPAPSAEDRAVTTRLIECGHLLGIPVLDHVIIGTVGFHSLRRDGGDQWSAPAPVVAGWKP